MRNVKKKLYYSLNDFLIFNDSQFVFYQNKKRANEFLPPKENEKLKNNIAMKWISKSGIEYEVKRVIDLIKKESQKYPNFNEDKFKEIEKKSSSYFMDKEIKILMKDPRSITKLINNLIKEDMLGEYDFKSFSGESLGKNDFIKDNKETKKAIDKKYKYIIQATLLHENFYGIADILKHNGDHYEVMDIKRSNKAKSKFVMQICAYSDILSKIQNKKPDKGYILLGNSQTENLDLDEYFSYYKRLKQDFDNFNETGETPLPEQKDLNSIWSEEAHEILKDKIESIIGISQDEIQVLKDQKIFLKEDLIKKEIFNLPSSVSERLKAQAKIKEGDMPSLIPQYKGEPGNLLQLDSPKNFDMYLDVKKTESLDKEPFTYLYNLLYRNENGDFIHKYFTCSNQRMEEATFVEFMIFIKSILEKSEDAKIFHFSPNTYDLLLETSSTYDKDLSLIQKLYKSDRLICLQTYFKQSIVLAVKDYSIESISEALNLNLKSLGLGFESPLLSLLNYKTGLDAQIEEDAKKILNDLLQDKVRFFVSLHAYMVNLRDSHGYAFIPKEDRAEYRAFKENLIKKIEKRNEEERVLQLKIQEAKDKKDTLFYMLEDMEEELKDNPDKALQREFNKMTKELDAANKLLDDEERKEALKEKIDSLDVKYSSKTYFDLDSQDKTVVLLTQLRKFLRKEFEVELLEKKKLDVSNKMDLNNNFSTLTDLIQINKEIKIERKKEVAYITYNFNPLELTDLKEGSEFCLIKYSHIKGKILSIDENEIELRFTQTAVDKGICDFERISIRKDMQINTTGIQKVIDDNILSIEKDLPNLNINKALYDFLMRKKPDVNIEGNLYEKNDNLIEKMIEVVNQMNETTLVIQGPPGAGKSYSSSFVIENLLEQGYKIGISSNSNSAIDNLLLYVKKNSSFPVFKNAAKISEDLESEGVMNSRSKEFKEDYAALMNSDQGVVVGATAFAMKDIPVDFLFVDEAGQVSLLNLIAMANKAKNIILIGDQQQLEQPIKAVHPGESGLSCLEYYLEEKVIPKDKGFFLPISYRMNKDLCKVVSKHFYENELKSAEEIIDQKKVDLNLSDYKNSGIEYIKVNHKNNSKYSIEEVQAIKDLVEKLCKDKITIDNEERNITINDIIIVSPYNAQVSKLKEHLPEAKVGTVDMFQGQEAPIAIYSLTASDVSYKGIEFLLNPNRVNVALSRGQGKAFIVGSEQLLYQEVQSLEELKLLNMYVELMEN